jgi:lipoprotein-anchoring transpeptidase ErfK/SrfK
VFDRWQQKTEGLGSSTSQRFQQWLEAFDHFVSRQSSRFHERSGTNSESYSSHAGGGEAGPDKTGGTSGGLPGSDTASTAGPAPRSLGKILMACAAVAMAGLGVYAYDQDRANVIAQGVTVGGVNVSRMTPAGASQLVSQRLSGPLNRQVTITGGGKQFQLSSQSVGLRLDPPAMSQTALNASRHQNIALRTADSVLDIPLASSLPPQIGYSPQGVSSMISTVKKQLDQPARDATVQPSADTLNIVPQADGHLVDAGALYHSIVSALASPTTDRSAQVSFVTDHPHVTVDQLPGIFPVYITVDRSNFQLRLWKNLKLAATYPIAVGQSGLETTAGVHYVQEREVDPAWHVPESSWAGGLAGQTIPSSSPQDPLKARWLGIGDGEGIHGTNETGSIGTAGSHGCIRMRIGDVEELYPQVPTNTPVYVH